MPIQPLRNPVTQWNSLQAAKTLNSWRQLLPLGAPHKYGSDKVLFWQGESPSEIFLLAHGIIKLTCTMPDGQESLLMLRYTGQLVEECTCILRVPSLVTATTITPCDIYRFDIDRLLRTEQSNPEVSTFHKHAAALDLYNISAAHIELKKLPLRERLQRSLWEIATVQGGRPIHGRVEFVLPLDNVEMAQWLGISPGQYKETRAALEKAGWLRRNGKMWAIADLQS